MSDFLAFMQKRQNDILSGKIGQGSTKSLGAYNRKHSAHCHGIATGQAAVDRSDPFTYNRTMSHLTQGINSMTDYEMEMGQERRETSISVALADKFGLDPKVTHNMAKRRKIPCF